MILLCFAEFIVVLDASIVNVALPSIGKGLHFSDQNLPWVVNAYLIAFGGFLLLGGRAADLVGRRRVFMAGLLTVGVASLAAGFAATQGELIAARAAQGLGAAMISPAALSIITTLFKDGAEWGGAQQGTRSLGRRRRHSRRRGRTARRDPHRQSRLGVGAVGERSGRGDRAGADARPDR